MGAASAASAVASSSSSSELFSSSPLPGDPAHKENQHLNEEIFCSVLFPAELLF